MDLAQVDPTMAVEEESLRIALERLLSNAQRRAIEIIGWTREPSPVAGVFPVEVLRVSLADGAQIALFVKHLGPEQADHPDKQCRDREPRIYEDLLRDDGLPVPRYYGSRWNEVTSRRELFLEYVADWSLKYQDLGQWFAAAPRLAELHARFAGRAAELRSRDYLLRLDERYFEDWARRAVATVGRRSPPLADALAGVVDGHGAVAELLARQPPTLVHNDLAPKNVIADRSREPARICFVDWEMAGVGCALLDLVHLKHGLDPSSDRAMCTAYSAALQGTGLLPSSAPELRRLFLACELHHTVYRLASHLALQLPLDRVTQWIADARDLSERFRFGGDA